MNLIAIDSEGKVIEGTHRLTLIGAKSSLGSKIMMFNANGITAFQMGSFLKSLAAMREKEQAKIIIFGALYDWIHYAKTLAGYKGSQTAIDSKQWIPVDGWKGLTVCFERFHHLYKILAGKNDGTGWKKSFGFEINDIYGFFQGSFVKACAQEGIELDSEVIEAGKASRSSGFQGFTEQDVKRYQEAELDALLKLGAKLGEKLDQCDIQVKNLTGAATIANAMLAKHQMHRFTPAKPESEILQYTYFGGIFWTIEPGYHKKCYAADLKSAYPYVIETLPSSRYKLVPDDIKPSVVDLQIWKCKWTYSGKYPALQWRDKDGSVLYPSSGEGYYFNEEVEAVDSQERNALDCEVTECYTVQFDDEYSRPFHWVRTLFNERLEMEKHKKGSGLPIKLGLNSIYGKTIQKHYGGRVPRYFSLLWGNLITMRTRVRIRQALARLSRPVAIATDGVYSCDPLPADWLKAKAGLGEWEDRGFAVGYFLGNGIYQYGEEIHTRGHRLQYFTDAQYYDGKQSLWDSIKTELKKGIWPTESFSYKTTNMVTPGMARLMKRPHLMGEFLEFPRSVNLHEGVFFRPELMPRFVRQLDPPQGVSHKKTENYDEYLAKDLENYLTGLVS